MIGMTGLTASRHTAEGKGGRESGWSVFGFFCLLCSLKRVSPIGQDIHLFPEGSVAWFLRQWDRTCAWVAYGMATRIWSENAEPPVTF